MTIIPQDIINEAKNWLLFTDFQKFISNTHKRR